MSLNASTKLVFCHSAKIKICLLGSHHELSCFDLFLSKLNNLYSTLMSQNLGHDIEHYAMKILDYACYHSTHYLIEVPIHTLKSRMLHNLTIVGCHLSKVTVDIAFAFLTVIAARFIASIVTELQGCSRLTKMPALKVDQSHNCMDLKLWQGQEVHRPGVVAFCAIHSCQKLL